MTIEQDDVAYRNHMATAAQKQTELLTSIKFSVNVILAIVAVAAVFILVGLRQI